MIPRIQWVVAALAIFISFTAWSDEKPKVAEKALTAQQEVSLKEAGEYITKAEKLVAAMEKASAEWKAGDVTVQATAVDIQLNERFKVVTQLNNAGQRFSRVPNKHSKVAEEIKRYDTVKTLLATVEANLIAIRNGLDATLKLGTTPEYKVAFDRLKEIYMMYANPGALRTNPDRAVDAAKQIGAAKAERARIAAKYEGLLGQKTNEAEQMRQILAASDKVFIEYDKSIATFLAAAPGEIDKFCDEAIRLAKSGVEKKKPLFFAENGGVNQTIKQAENHFAVFAAIAPDTDGVKRSRTKIDDTRKSANQMGISILESILESNRVPEDKFAETDRTEVLKILTDSWSKNGNGAAALKIGVIDKQWTRKTKWVWSNGNSSWEKVDESMVQGFIVVKLNDTQAAVWPVNLFKNHLAKDEIKAYMVFDVKGEVGVGSKVLLKNVEAGK